MGTRGPQRTPTALLKLHGSRLGNDRDKTEPKPEKKTPDCPDWLGDDARQVWDQVVPMLNTMRVLTVADGGPLSRYCESWVRWKKCLAFVKEHGETYVVKHELGDIKAVHSWPEVVTLRGLAAELLRIEQEFGLTPAARARIQLEPEAAPTVRTRERRGGA